MNPALRWAESSQSPPRSLGSAEFGFALRAEGSCVLCCHRKPLNPFQKEDFQGQTAGNGNQRGWERSLECSGCLNYCCWSQLCSWAEKEQFLFCTQAEQTQTRGTESASTMLKDFIWCIIKYPLERKILIGLQACE